MYAKWAQINARFALRRIVYEIKFYLRFWIAGGQVQLYFGEIVSIWYIYAKLAQMNVGFALRRAVYEIRFYFRFWIAGGQVQLYFEEIVSIYCINANWAQINVRFALRSTVYEIRFTSGFGHQVATCHFSLIRQTLYTTYVPNETKFTPVSLYDAPFMR